MNLYSFMYPYMYACNLVCTYRYVYAMWCGHCKAVEPVLKALSERFQYDQNMIITRIEGGHAVLCMYIQVFNHVHICSCLSAMMCYSVTCCVM
jgi:thiol-disulfide isomerase/thioredoxin